MNTLYISSNELQDLPLEIEDLKGLNELDLSDNKPIKIPVRISKFKNMIQLYISDNQLTDLPAEISQMESLTHLDINSNKLMSLPVEIAQLQKLTRLDLRNNRLLIPPEILAAPSQPAKILKFYNLLEQETDRLYEAKFLIVGEAGAGKTTLAEKIKDENYPLRQDELSTEGIDVNQWQFPLDNGEKIRVNIWDFGGQEIYHSTHQFFLTKRSLYALVVDSRREDTDFYVTISEFKMTTPSSHKQ